MKKNAEHYLKMKRDVAIFFRNQFRDARAAVLRDAEAADAVIHAVERLGMFRSGSMATLGAYEGDINSIAKQSPLASKVPKERPAFHMQFSSLYKSVREARNVAMHEGAYARHLANHAVKLGIILEDALMNGLDKVGDRMVENPVCAETWQPLSFIRQTMLENSFSFLPVKTSTDGRTEWKLVSDIKLARYLRRAQNEKVLKERLVQSLADARSHLELHDCQTLYNPSDPVSVVLEELGHLPVLVMREKGSADLVGILTAFDLL